MQVDVGRCPLLLYVKSFSLGQMQGYLWCFGTSRLFPEIRGPRGSSSCSIFSWAGGGVSRRKGRKTPEVRGLGQQINLEKLEITIDIFFQEGFLSKPSIPNQRWQHQYYLQPPKSWNLWHGRAPGPRRLESCLPGNDWVLATHQTSSLQVPILILTRFVLWEKPRDIDTALPRGSGANFGIRGADCGMQLCVARLWIALFKSKSFQLK